MMRPKLFYIAAFLALPIGMVILVALAQRGQPSSQERRAAMWFENVKAGQPSRDFDSLTNMGPVAVSVLQKTLSSSKSADQRKAVWILGQMGQTASPAIPDLVKTCGSNYFFPVRMAAIDALMTLDTTDHHERIVAEFQPLLSDPHPGIQNTVVNVLNKIEVDRKARGLESLITNEVEYAIVFTRSPASRVRLMGLDRLIHFREHNEQALNAIKELARDEDALIARQADAFIKNYGSYPPYPSSRMTPERFVPPSSRDAIRFRQ